MIGENGHRESARNNGTGRIDGPPFQGFPSLPIVTPDPPRRTQAEKYGGLFYLGIGGLAVLLSLVGWFSIKVWSLRDVWANVYILSDPGKPEDRRIEAAYALSRDPHATSQQRLEIALRKELPDLARYLIAESLDTDVVIDDLRGYTTMVARSEGWPDWLRLLLARPLALASAGGASIPAEPLDELRRHRDPILGLWAAFAQAVSSRSAESAKRLLDEAATSPGPERELAEMLREAVSASEDKQGQLLDRATLWLRTHHRGASHIWQGWEVRDGKPVHASSP